jgi:hypothetical protein
VATAVVVVVVVDVLVTVVDISTLDQDEEVTEYR